MDDRNPLPLYSWMTYLSVIGIACFGGLVRHLNTSKTFNPVALAIDLCTASFTGVVTFWMCEWGNISGPLSAIMVATSGILGNRAWKELEHVWKARLYSVAGLPVPPDTPSDSTKPAGE